MTQQREANKSIRNGVKSLYSINKDLCIATTPAFRRTEGFFSEEDDVVGGSVWSKAALEGCESTRGRCVVCYIDGVGKGRCSLKEMRQARHKCMLDDPVQTVTRREQPP